MPWIQCQQVYNQQKKSKLSNLIFISAQFCNSKTYPGWKLARSRAVSWREWVETPSRLLHAYSRIRRSIPETNCHVTILRLQGDMLLISLFLQKSWCEMHGSFPLSRWLRKSSRLLWFLWFKMHRFGYRYWWYLLIIWHNLWFW